MKLFGGKNAKHSAVKHLTEGETSRFTPVNLEKEKSEPTANESKIALSAFLTKLPKSARIAIIAAAVLIVLVLAVVIAYAIWEEAPDVDTEGPKYQSGSASEVISLPGDSTTASPVITLPPTTEEPVAEQPEESPEPTPAGRNTDCYTFLIAAYDQYGASTDAILVGNLDVKMGTLDIVSIPRDTLVNVSWGVKKINTVLVNEDNEPEAFVNRLSDILGFAVDCYAIVDIEAMEKLVDCIGGVLYTVPFDMHYDDPSQDLSIHIESGYQYLNGEDFVKVLRYRIGNEGGGYANGDLGRIDTQHDLLRTFSSQLLTLGNIPNLTEAIGIFREHVVTNLSANNLAFFAREFLLLDESNIRFHTLPGEGAYIKSGAYYQISIVEWTEMINEHLNPYYEEITAQHLNVLQFVDPKTGAFSTNGEIIPYDSFYDFSSYIG